MRLYRNGSRLGRLPFFFVLNLTVAAVAAPVAPVSDETSRWVETIHFLDAEGDDLALDRVRDRILAERPQDLDVIRAYVEARLKRHDRPAIETFMRSIAGTLRCGSSVAPAFPRLPKGLCDELAKDWNHLSHVFFFETSARKMEKARRSLASKDCSAALRELKEVEAKEGAARPILILMSQAQECLKDAGGLSRTKVRLDETRIFAGDVSDR